MDEVFLAGEIEETSKNVVLVRYKTVCDSSRIRRLTDRRRRIAWII